MKLVSSVSESLTYLLINPRDILQYIELEEDLTGKCFIGECNMLLESIDSLKSLIIREKRDLKEYEVDYTKLFISSYPRPLCPPYESYYATGGKMLARPDIISDLKGILRKLKLKMDESKETLPDYIPAELELAGYLAGLEGEEMLVLLQQLAYKHFTVWLPEFPECILRNASTNYYRRLANTLKMYGECLFKLI